MLNLRRVEEGFHKARAYYLANKLTILFKISVPGNQGSNTLYNGSRAADVHRGHLNPCHINSYNQTYMRATFIYTNCVPQCGTSFNSGTWMAYEGRIARYTKYRCANQTGGTMYLVTGQSHYRIRVRSNGALAQVPTPIVSSHQGPRRRFWGQTRKV